MDRELFYGDNLEILRLHIPAESVDLIYLDPPFNSDQNYNVLFRERDGARSAAQIKAFDDTWRWDAGAAAAYEETIEAGGKVSSLLRAFRSFLGTNDMMAYLVRMAPRLVELARVLKPTGSIYLHCDPTASHYLKLLMDSIFGAENFLAEVTWKRTNTHSDAKRWSPVADVMLQYARSTNPTWHPTMQPLDAEYVESKYRFSDGDGRRYQLDNMTSPKPRPNMTYEWKGFAPPACGWRYSRETMARLDREGRIWYPKDKSKRPRLKRFLDESSGVLMGNVWTDIPPLNSQAQERLGYPTQKPEALLERIINASSNPGDVVLDPFCGCGTAVAAAERLGRKWIGIDVTHLAIGLIKSRLSRSFGLEEHRDYTVTGEPTSVPDAERLAAEDPYQFQCWILGLVGARPAVMKKGPDAGIDGRRVFVERERGSEEEIVFSVKAGKLALSYVRDLRGVIAREGAAIGVLLCCHEPTLKMRAEAAAAGIYQSAWGRYPRLQILTMAQLLAGAKVDCPAHVGLDRTIKPAPPRRPPQAEQIEMYLQRLAKKQERRSRKG